MLAALEPGTPSTRRALRRRAGLLLSVVLHLAVLGVAIRVHWPAQQMPAANAVARVVWMTELPNPVVEPPTEAPERVATAAAPTPEAVPPETKTPRIKQKPARGSVQPVEPAPTPALQEEPPSGSQRPLLDWEKERHDAVASVIAERANSRHYVTFSADDLVKEALAPPEPVPPPFVDDCVIAHGRMQVFMARMMGRCVREARGDLFAAIMPEYLTTRPVCAETHPDSPGSVLSDGTEISTVKCELVARAERR